MKVLVLGGTGYIGKRLLHTLAGTARHQAAGASRNPAASGSCGTDWIRLDTCNLAEMTQALQGFDAVVNCVAGDARSISEGAAVLVQAARNAGHPRLIHMSTMSVYGPAEGTVREDTPPNLETGWYGRAKCEAESHLGEHARQSGNAVVLRPGCVYGPGSELWVGRIARWLRAGRLGDLGTGGDGWSNLVHVDDVCQAVLACLDLAIPPGELPVFNMAAPDSPRWNAYFVDLALALQLTPVRRISKRQLQLDTRLAGPPLKLAQMLARRLGRSAAAVPDYIPPGLPALWSQHIHLDATQASDRLGMAWTPYAAGLQSSVAWIVQQDRDLSTKGRTECIR